MAWIILDAIPRIIGWTVISAVTIVFVLKKVLRPLLQGSGRRYKDGVLYLHMFPRQVTKGVVNLSPFAMKVETWLRMQGIPYEVGRRWLIDKAHRL